MTAKAFLDSTIPDNFLAAAEASLGKSLFPHQELFLREWMNRRLRHASRACLYYRTGSGKTITSLLGIRATGNTHALVIAPPVTHPDWHKQAALLGMKIETISHAKFRMKTFHVSRNVSIICDEFHLLGGVKAAGWKKFDAVAKHLHEPIIICSATPNYNDAERCYCIGHVLEPLAFRGGFLNFLSVHCATQANAFGMMPVVTGFLPPYNNAEEFLAAMNFVWFLPDNVQYHIEDLNIPVKLDETFTRYGLYARQGEPRLVASIIERQWASLFQSTIDPDTAGLRENLYEMLMQIAGEATTPILVFVASSRIGAALSKSLEENHVLHRSVDGSTTPKQKKQWVEEFKNGELDVLVGTATLATGLDGADKVCDTMVILADTPDPSLRRQLVGRILPRGEDTDATNKKFYRFVYDWEL